MSYNNYNRGYAEPTMTSADYMTRTYRWMALGLLITFAAAFVTATTPLFYVVNSLYLLFTIAELALVFVLSARVQNMSVGAARGVFLGYALLNGMVLSYYFLAFDLGTLVLAFLATSLYFGLMAVYGTTTHKDLSGWGPKLMMALFALLITGFVGVLFGGGLFERSHHLMGMENALCSYLEYPEEMAELLRVIADYKIDYIHEMGKQIRPDIIFYHDDWGSKQNVFLPPRVWREIIKPLQKEIADAIHEEGMIYMHHADCICQPLVTDMVEIGIDIWQGVIAQNDIVEIQRVTEGKLAMVGGIDGPKIDVENITEEQIRAEVRRAVDTYCPAGRFYPAIPNGWCFLEWNDKIEKDELKKYGREWALKHPIA